MTSRKELRRIAKAVLSWDNPSPETDVPLAQGVLDLLDTLERNERYDEALFLAVDRHQSAQTTHLQLVEDAERWRHADRNTA